MAEVVHTIKNNQYLYEHYRDGDTIRSKYIGPVGSGGKVRAAQHGGGAPPKVTQQDNKQIKEGKTINNKKDNSRVEQGAQEKSTMGTYFAKGNTFERKDDLKNAGMTWDANKKQWFTTDPTIKIEGIKLVKYESADRIDTSKITKGDIIGINENYGGLSEAAINNYNRAVRMGFKQNEIDELFTRAISQIDNANEREKRRFS